MRDLKINRSRVKELQTMLFPVQPIPDATGSALANLDKLHELKSLQLGRYDGLRQETELSIFSVPFASKNVESQDALRIALDTRFSIDGITREAARWPMECQVLPDRIIHINYTPTTPEPFYLQTGREPRPRPLGDELGSVIFRYCPTSVTNYFHRSCVGGSTVVPFSSEFPLESNGDRSTNVLLLTEIGSDSDLRFESRFESGNLCKVVKITDTYYQLYLRKDLYTQRHTQWYYFRISNTKSGTTYRLSIVNLCKDNSLYNEGLKPLLYSTEDAKKRAIGWRRCGENIAYYRNDSDEEKEKHTLTFNVSFPYDRDTVYLAHCYPYTYTDLQEYLTNLVSDPVKTRFTKLRLLCRTLAGNGVYYLTITAPTYDEEVRRKRGIVITARVHPGETPSSWTMKGMIDFLTGESGQARALREKFIFKLIPMLNPDGVIVGNNRCSLSGKDLNRQYRTVMRESYPSVWHTKLMIRRLLEDCGVAIYCDLHAHSKKHNIFIYGCESKRTMSQARLSEQVFPLMLHKNAADKFSFENCKFQVEKGKEGTGRVVVWSMGVQNSYTMEASMGGTNMGSRSGTHFSIQDYEQIGRVFCETLLDFFDSDPLKERLRSKIIGRLTKEGSSAEEPTNIDLTDYSSDEGDTSSSSTSDKEEDTWSYSMREENVSPQYLCAPPPTPSLISRQSYELARRRCKKTASINKTYLRRRRIMTRRTVMDLPIMDPGSDLCDFTDSADEEPNFSAKRKIENEESSRLADTEIEKSEKMNAESQELALPEINLNKGISVVNERPHCLRLVRSLKHRSPNALKNQDLQIKLNSLGQQIWMGVSISDEKNIENKIENRLRKSPLSWGLSKMALSQENIKSDDLLKYCSTKLRSLEYANLKNEDRRRIQTESTEPAKSLSPRNEDVARKSRKKRSSVKWQRIVGLNSRVEEIRHGKTSFLTIKADSVKLVTLETPAKVQTRHRRPETRRKNRKNESTSPVLNTEKETCLGMAETRLRLNPRSQIHLQPLIVPLCNSLSSDSDSSDSRKRRMSKRKQKKKKKKQLKTIPIVGRKKHTASANLLCNL